MYAPALLVSALVAAIVSRTAWNRRGAPGAVELAATMLSLCVWSGTYAFRWLAQSPGMASFWLDATYIGVVTVPTALLFLVLRFTGNERVLKSMPPVFFAIEPVLTLIFLFTDNLHGLFYGGQRASGAILNGGPWFWFNVVYSYGLNLMAFTLLIRQIMHSRNFLQKQAFIILIGLGLPWAASILSLVGYSPFPGLDLTPFIFTASGIVFAYGLFRTGFLDIVPIARDTLVEKMVEGLMVIDGKSRIVDLNPAAVRIFGLEGPILGRQIQEILPQLPQSAMPATSSGETRTVFNSEADPDRHIEVQTSPLSGKGNRNLGRLILFRDITDRKRTEDELVYRSTHDVLTGLSNRQHFESESERIRSAGIAPVGVVMMDVDELKDVNDRLGHNAGDELLKAAARIISSNVNPGNFAARIGGDEFVVILPGAGEFETKDFVIRLGRAIATYNEDLRCTLPLSISMGYACSSESQKDNSSLPEVLRRADTAMYTDKNARKLLRSAG